MVTPRKLFAKNTKRASEFDGSLRKKGRAVTRPSKISGTLRLLPSVPCLLSTKSSNKAETSYPSQLPIDLLICDNSNKVSHLTRGPPSLVVPHHFRLSYNLSNDRDLANLCFLSGRTEVGGGPVASKRGVHSLLPRTGSSVPCTKLLAVLLTALRGKISGHDNLLTYSI
jgi:hypothetical protein